MHTNSCQTTPPRCPCDPREHLDAGSVPDDVVLDRVNARQDPLQNEHAVVAIQVARNATSLKGAGHQPIMCKASALLVSLQQHTLATQFSEQSGFRLVCCRCDVASPPLSLQLRRLSCRPYEAFLAKCQRRRWELVVCIHRHRPREYDQRRERGHATRGSEPPWHASDSFPNPPAKSKSTWTRHGKVAL